MTDLQYNEQGTGTPVVLVHSGGTDSREWQFILPALSQSFRVITYDVRGAGQSPVPDQPVNHIADLHDLLTTLHLDKVTLVGHSMGGQICTDYTLAYPEQVDKLVLLAPGLTGYVSDAAFDAYSKAIFAVVPNAEKMLNIMLSAPDAYAVQETMRSPQRNLFVQIHRENVQKSLTWKSLEQTWPHPSAIDRLPAINTPTLYIVGSADKADIKKITALFHQLPDIRFEQIEQADHGLTFTHGHPIAQLTSTFLKAQNG